MMMMVMMMMMMMTTTSFTQMTTEIVFHMTTHQVYVCFHCPEYHGSKPRPWFRFFNFFCHIKGGGKTWVRRLLPIMIPYLVVMLSMTKIAKSLRRVWNVFWGTAASLQSPLKTWVKPLWWGFFTTCPLWSSSLSSVWSVPLAVDSWCWLDIIINGVRCRRKPVKNDKNRKNTRESLTFWNWKIELWKIMFLFSSIF